jgi:hypothetical protein
MPEETTTVEAAPGYGCFLIVLVIVLGLLGGAAIGAYQQIETARLESQNECVVEVQR